MPWVEVRLLGDHDEFRQCERVQKIVWGTFGVSSEVMTVTQKYGGAVIGAFAGARIVGYIYAFLARRKGRLIHWSHQMAVDPAYRDRGIGFRMKLAHRKLALAQGIRSICWTYDPLQSRNATLNLYRLGAQVEDYIPNCYGNFPSRIEQGLTSDRFVVNWRIATRRVERRLRQGPSKIGRPLLPLANETRFGEKHFLENTRIHLNLHAPQILVEIPARTDAMRSRALPLARRWRFQVRRIFERYLTKGYRVVEFLPPLGPRSRTTGPALGRRCFYVLRWDRSRSA